MVINKDIPYFMQDYPRLSDCCEYPTIHDTPMSGVYIISKYTCTKCGKVCNKARVVTKIHCVNCNSFAHVIKYCPYPLHKDHKYSDEAFLHMYFTYYLSHMYGSPIVNINHITMNGFDEPLDPDYLCDAIYDLANRLGYKLVNNMWKKI